MTCINIGCGDDVKKFWINVDAYPNSPNVKEFNLTSSNDLEWIATMNISKAECMHVIGYINYKQAENFFSAIYKGLVSNGVFILEFPDIMKLNALLDKLDVKDNNYLVEYTEIIRAIYAYDFDDAFDEKFSSYTYIYGWTKQVVESLLYTVGFSEVKVEDPKTHGKRFHRDTRLVAFK